MSTTTIDTLISEADIKARIRTLAAEKAFFRMSDIADSSFDFDSISVDASFAKGSAEVQNAAIAGRNETISFNGVVPVISPVATLLQKPMQQP